MELINKKVVIIDYYKSSNMPVHAFYQHDNNQLEFVIEENGTAADLSNVSRVLVNIKRPDGKVVSRELDRDGNVILYKMQHEEMKVSGHTVLTLQFYNEDGDRLSTAKITIYIASTVEANVEFKDKQGTLYQQIIMEIEGLKDQLYTLNRLTEEKGETAESKGKFAEEKAQEAIDAAELAAEEAANLSQLKTDVTGATEAASAAAEAARTNADHAKTQGDYAKEQADVAAQRTEELNGLEVSQFYDRQEEFSRQLADIVYNFNSKEGVDATGQEDVTPLLNSVILELCNKTNGQKRITFNGLYKITGTVLLPTGVLLDLNGSTLIGGGYNTNAMFMSGVYNSAAKSITPYNDSSYTTSVERAGIMNGVIRDCGKAFDLVKMNRGCCFENIYFQNCEQAVRAIRCYYSTFKKLVYRSAQWGVMDDSENPSFDFRTENNVMDISHISVSNRKLGMQLFDITSGINIKNCSFESCEVGFKESGNSIRNLKITDCYTEACTIGFQLTLRAEVDNCFFNNCQEAIQSALSVKINANNYFMNCPIRYRNTNVDGGGNDFVELTPVIAYGMSPNIEIGSDLVKGAFSQIKQKSIQTKGNNFVINSALKGQVNDFNYAGKNGFTTGEVPFCTVTRIGETNFDLQIDTNITWEEYSFLGYKFRVQDTNSIFNFHGLIFGQTLQAFNTGSRIPVLSNNNGMLRITLPNFNSPTNFYHITGVVRHL